MVRLAPRWRAGVAIIAGYALALQALLHVFAPLAHAWPNPHGSVSIICPASGYSPPQGGAPGAPDAHWDAACCFFCLGPGLHVATADTRIAVLEFHPLRSSPVTAWVGVDPRRPPELLLVNARAPPRFA